MPAHILWAGMNSSGGLREMFDVRGYAGPLTNPPTFEVHQNPSLHGLPKVLRQSSAQLLRSENYRWDSRAGLSIVVDADSREGVRLLVEEGLFGVR